MQDVEGTLDPQKSLRPPSDDSQNMIQALVFRNLSIDGNDDQATDRITLLVRLLNEDVDSNLLRASWVHSFWIQRDEDESPTEASLLSLQEALPTLLSRMKNLNELFCRFDLQRPQIASIAHSHGSRLTKLAIDIDGRLCRVQETLSLLKHFTALTDLHLGVNCWTGGLDLIERPELPNLRLVEVAAEYATNNLLGWLTDWVMPMLSAFAIWKPHDIWRELSNLPAFMAKHGAGLTMLQLDDSLLTHMSDIFDHTPFLEIFDTFDTRGPLENLPRSVTQIVLRQFPENIGRGVQTLESLLRIVQSLPSESKLNTIRMCSINEYLGAKPFLWREKMKLADTRRVGTWKDFRKNVKELSKLGVLLLDQQDVALTEVLTEMGALQELESDDEGDDGHHD
jgi:hypothetical protein